MTEPSCTPSRAEVERSQPRLAGFVAGLALMCAGVPAQGEEAAAAREPPSTEIEEIRRGIELPG